MPTRISFRVQSRMDSRVVMDQNGAELLLGQGDMLFMPPGASKPIRSQGTFIDDKEIRDSVKLVKSLADAQYEPELVQIKATYNADGEMEKDELFDDAVRIVLESKRGSVSLLQRRLTDRLRPRQPPDRNDGPDRHRRRLQRLTSPRSDVHAGRMGRDESPADRGRRERDDGVTPTIFVD